MEVVVEKQNTLRELAKKDAFLGLCKEEILKLYSTEGAKSLGLEEPLRRKVKETVLKLELEKKYEEIIDKLEAEVKATEKSKEEQVIKKNWKNSENSN